MALIENLENLSWRLTDSIAQAGRTLTIYKDNIETLGGICNEFALGMKKQEKEIEDLKLTIKKIRAMVKDRNLDGLVEMFEATPDE